MSNTIGLWLQLQRIWNSMLGGLRSLFRRHAETQTMEQTATRLSAQPNEVVCLTVGLRCAN